jgi:hypothetical protein
MLRLVAAILLGLGASASAQLTLTQVGGKGGGAAYSAGPGDIIPGAYFWGGLRGYSAAYAATGTGLGVNVRRASDNTRQDIVILQNGALDIATANTFAGTDATCTGSMVGTTTLTVSSCTSGTLKVSDTITGAGIVQPMFITAIGTCGAPPGTCTVNAAQTFGSQTITAQVALFLHDIYDQSGNNRGLTQGTNATEPQLLPNCVSGLPCAYFAGAQNIFAGPSPVGISQPYYTSTTKNLTSAVAGTLFSPSTNTNTPNVITTSTVWELFCSGMAVGNASTLNTWYTGNGTWNGASSSFISNGTSASGTVCASQWNTVMAWGWNQGGSNNFMVGYSTEVGFWLGDKTSSNVALDANQRAYWGF